jgi:hypothetical protein
MVKNNAILSEKIGGDADRRVLFFVNLPGPGLQVAIEMGIEYST